MGTRNEKGKPVGGEKDLRLKEIILSDNSNIILPEVSLPSTYQTQEGDVKYGAKYRVSEHDLADYRRRVTRDTTLTSDEIKTLVADTNERRRALQQSIVEQKAEFEQKRIAELEVRYTKEREEQLAHRIANENDTQREMRIHEEEAVKTNRVREIQALQNKCKKEKEQVTMFFEQSSNRFNEKYNSPSLRIKISGDTGIDRIISSRPFSTNRYVHRCTVCGYHFPESLSISKIYQHQFENKDSHIQQALDEVDKYYSVAINETRRKHAQEDNPTLRNQKLSKEIESLSKLRGAKYR
jgi:hypothetical protein